MISIGVIVASTRTHRRGRAVGDWVLATAREVGPDAQYTLLDLADFALPLLDEPAPAITGVYRHEHTRRWSVAVADLDGYVIVTPEYNHGVPGALKNAIDYLFDEWRDKAVGFVSYGAHGGVRAVEQLRQIAGEVNLADVRTQVVLSAYTDFDYSDADLEDPTTTGNFAPDDRHAGDLAELLAEVERWSRALSPLRTGVI